MHIMPRQGWINDPCAPGYDASSRTYHVGFQWNPIDTEWGNISWGAAHSRDLVSWTTSQGPTLTPARPHDRAGVFTGCLRSSDIDGSTDRGVLTCAYTAVKQLPIHHSIPYIRGSETVALAVSSDAGRTWTSFEKNPVVAEPPPDLDISGWRDPYVAPWPVVDGLLRHGKIEKEAHTGRESLYGLLSGGVRGRSPTTFLYEIDGAGLDRWQYLGPLIEPGLNFSPCPRWVGDFGVNWEVCNFVTLSDKASGASQEFIICGVEGRIPPPKEILRKGEFRATHAQMWLSGPVRCEDQVPRMSYRVGGTLDHGSFYAGNSFWDPQTEEHIIFGWLLEDDLSTELRERQGWAGVLSLPRVMKLLVLHSIVGALVSKLASIACFEFVHEDDSLSRYTGYTLCTVPDPRLEKLRLEEQRLFIQDENEPLVVYFTKPLTTWEAKISFFMGDLQSRVGFSILYGDDENTDIYFEPSAEAVVIDRSKSSSIPAVRKGNERAPHTLFKFASPPSSQNGHDEAHILETLEFHVFYDCSVLEVFVNRRTVISTRVYPSSGTSIGLVLLRDHSGQKHAELLQCRLWPLETRGVCV
ncbi:hypothetical protein VTI74DRAFT_2032 [Chaetomium olivicolor]